MDKSPEITPPKELSIKISGKSQANFKHPERNEDTIAFDAKAGFAMVLDGMGGVGGAQEASNLARDVIADNLYRKENNLEVAKQHLKNLLLEASRSVKAESGAGGTTAVVVKIVNVDSELTVLIASVGDSRAYILREGNLRLITEDDSVIPPIDRERFDETDGSDIDLKYDYAIFSMRNRLTQAIGSSDELNVHIYSEVLKKGDRIILTSDGVHDNLRTSEIRQIAGSQGDVAEELVAKAVARSKDNLLRSKPDDISAIVMEVA